MAKVEIYSKDWCPYCVKAKALLSSKNIDYTEIDITEDAETENKMVIQSGRRTVPQLFIEGEPIGGYDDLAELNALGELDKKLGIKASNNIAALYDVVM